MFRGGRQPLVVRSQQPDVENKKEERINFDIPQQVGTQPVSSIADDGRRVERMFSNLNEVSLKHEPGKPSILNTELH